MQLQKISLPEVAKLSGQVGVMYYTEVDGDVQYYLGGGKGLYPAGLSPAAQAFAGGQGGAVVTADKYGRFALPSLSRLGGCHIGFFGASLEMRNRPIFSALNAQYRRRNGIVTFVTAGASGLFQRFRGHRIHVSSKEVPDVEGVFELLANTTDDGSFTTFTYADPRADRDLGPGLGVNVCDLHAWSFSGSWASYMSAALGARVRCSGLGISGAEINDLYRPDVAATRIDQFLRLHREDPFDAVLMMGGGLGNAIASANTNNGAADLLEQISTMIQKLAAAGVKAIFFATTTVSRGKLPTVQPYTRGAMVQRYLYSEIAKRFPFVRILQIGEAMGTSYQATYNATPSDDVLYGYPPAEWMDNDGVHQSFRLAIREGMMAARVLSPLVQEWVPYQVGYADTRPVNNVADKDGALNPSILPSWYGNLSTSAIAGTGISGIAPANVTVALGARGAAAVVGSIVQEIEGGNNFQLAVTDAAPSGQGCTVSVTWTPPELLAAFNSAEFQGQLIDLYMPMEVKGQAEAGLRHCECMLLGITADGVPRVIAAPLLEQGDNTMLSGSRHMGDEGLSGVFRAPRVRVPAVVYTSVRLIWNVRHVGSGDNAGGPVAYTLTIGPQTRLELAKVF